jgi:two-component system, NtrC family, response regulator HydG
VTDNATLQRDSSPVGPKSFAVLVTDGVDKGARLIILAGQTALVGKSPTCDLVLRDPEVSRRHLRLEATQRGLLMTDLGSTNGTFVGSVAVMAAVVAARQSVRLGRTVLSFLEGPAEGASVQELGFGRMLGDSVSMRRLFARARRAAEGIEPVLIQGEVGSGRALLAECIHEEGPRRTGPFVVLLGAHTTDTALQEAFAAARGGTLLVDEVAALSADHQRVLERELATVDPQKARVIGTTSKDLDREVDEGRFGDALLLALAHTTLDVPPLRARRGDAMLLAKHFHASMNGIGELPSAIVEATREDAFVGSVRDLAAFVAQVVVGAAPSNDVPTTGDFIDSVLGEDLPMTLAREKVVAEFERRYVDRALDRSGGHVGKAAAAAGVARRYFQILRSRSR